MTDLEKKKMDFWTQVFCVAWDDSGKTLKEAREIADLALVYFNNTNWNINTLKESP